MRQTEVIKVVGLSFVAHYPHNLLALAGKLDEAAVGDVRATGGWGDVQSTARTVPVLLHRNPANEYDVNAIEVHVPVLGRQQFVGHVPRELAARWAPRLDAGELVTARALMVLVQPRHPERPGLEIEVVFHGAGCGADPRTGAGCSCNNN